ncbi:uncharacterized protein [Apostichopus japonicus]|uniref:uncharacterized protein isoform X7 n=1 Tax=Stichopus japonicus TaxID=307972 RepID=UPI003AB323AF
MANTVKKEAAESSENKYKKHNVNTLLERQRSHLSRHRADLVQRIPTMDVVDRLIELHGAPEEQIQCELDNKGSVRANRQLLKVVMGLHDGYVKLVKALDKIPGMSDLVEKLSKDDKGPIHRYDKQVALQDVSAPSLSGIPVPSQSADVPHSKKRCYIESTATLMGGVEDSAASSYDTLVAARLSQSPKRTYYQSLAVKQPLENIDRVVTTESLRDLSVKIPKEWKNVGRNLGLNYTVLYILERDNNNLGHKETVYRMLLTWKHINGSKATYRVLGEAFIAAGRRDLQEYCTSWDVSAPSLSGIPVPSQSADVPHSKKRCYIESTAALMGGVEDSAASSYDTLVAARLSQSPKRTYYQSLAVKQPLENIDREVRKESLLDLSRKIKNEWKHVGRNLGLDDSELCTLERDNTNNGRTETVYQMLLYWKQSNGSQATYRVLGEALIAAKRRDLQEKLYKLATIQNDN